jgi:hypothetical protein
MVLKIVKYLGQQGYGTDNLVVLTPYLGQLHQLRNALKKDNDPLLGDLDSYDLVKAGLLDPATAKQNKKPIRLSTIGKCCFFLLFRFSSLTISKQITTRERRATLSLFPSQEATRRATSDSCTPRNV